MSNVSYYAIKTIFFFKIKEFFSEYQYSIISPLITIFIFFGVIIILSDNFIFAQNDNYLKFVIPGFIIMIVMQTSYTNISENLITMKQIGSFNDYLVSPISRIEILMAFMIANIFISLFLALISLFFFSFFIELYSLNYFLFIYYLLLTSIIFSSIGSVVGFLFFTWDMQQAILNFLIIPISLLSGTFFSSEVVNSKWIFLFKYNPFYLIVDSFRKCFDDIIQINYKFELYIIFFTLIFLLISIFIFKKGYKVIQ